MLRAQDGEIEGGGEVRFAGQALPMAERELEGCERNRRPFDGSNGPFDERRSPRGRMIATITLESS
jgi:hypothetical protein